MAFGRQKPENHEDGSAVKTMNDVHTRSLKCSGCRFLSFYVYAEIYHFLQTIQSRSDIYKMPRDFTITSHQRNHHHSDRNIEGEKMYVYAQRAGQRMPCSCASSTDSFPLGPVMKAPDSRRTDYRYTARSIVLDTSIETIQGRKYQFEKEIGRGSYGAVYAARRIPDGN